MQFQYHLFDLVLLNVSKQNKVVCKFDDLTKLQYKARRKAAEDRLNNIEKNKREKTVKFKSNMGENDIERQINQIKKFGDECKTFNKLNSPTPYQFSNTPDAPN